MTDLKDAKHSLPEGVEIAVRLVTGDQSVKLSSENLHSQQSEDNDEQEEQDEQTGNRTH